MKKILAVFLLILTITANASYAIANKSNSDIGAMVKFHENKKIVTNSGNKGNINDNKGKGDDHSKNGRSSSVPESGTIILLGSGLLAYCVFIKKRNTK